MIRKICCLLNLMFFFIIVKVKAQQDIQFSQYIFNGLTINPAYAGYKEDLYMQALYRQQWTGFPGAPKTGGISVDGLTNIPDKVVGFGAQLLWEKLGAQQSTSFFGNYAYRIRMDEEDTKRLCLGVGGGVTQYVMDGTMLDPSDGDDRYLPYGKISKWVPNARFGVYFYTPSWYAGLSVLDLFSLSTERSLYYSNGKQFTTLSKTAHLYFTAGTVFSLSEDIKLKPSLLWKEDFKGPSSIDVNVFALLSERLWVGGSYRTSMLIGKKNLQSGLTATTAVSILAEFYVNENIRIGYSFDIATNGLTGHQGGSHEISLGITIFNKKGETIYNPRYF